MEQAVIIIAHKNYQQVFQLAKMLNTVFNVYIHFDAKMNLSDIELNKINSLTNVTAISKYKINWSTYDMVRAELDLFRLALKNKKNNYFHIISGQDWPIVSADEIFDFYKNQNTDFIDSSPAKGTQKAHESLVWWVKFYYNYNKINRRTLFGKIYHRVLIGLQLMLHVNKLAKYNLQDTDIYAGQSWCDLTRLAIETVVNEMEKDSRWERLFQYSFCSDEFFIPTILNYSDYEFKPNDTIRRYIVWSERHSSYPAILDESDLNDIKKSNCFWMRKIDLPLSEKLLERLSGNNK